MWRNFISSIGLLAVALMTALYSSSATRDGRNVSAVISAFLALGIATWVGVRFVPRLASHVDWEWLPFISRYHVTKEGWMYCVAVCVVLFAAVNTSNNLLYIVLSALLAVIVLSAFLSALNFKMLRVEVRLPAHCYAGDPFPIAVQLRNGKAVFPTFSITFGPTKDSDFRFSTFYVPILRGGEEIAQTGQAMLVQRGRFDLREINASSRYPFGFFVKDRKYPVEAHCICYPAILPEDELDFGAADLMGSQDRFERGLGHDLYTIRDYVPSDSARHVHWKASAKTSTLKTREYAAEENRSITLAFDRFGRAGDAAAFEHLVSTAATIAFHLNNAGVEVALISDDWSGSTLESVLEYLALVKMSADANYPPSDDDAVRLSLRS